MSRAIVTRLADLERKIPERAEHVDVKAACRAYEALLAQPVDLPRENISLHEAARRYQAALEGGSQ